MANPNLEKINLVEVQSFQNGERANATNLNRPILQLQTNIQNQKSVLDSVIDMLGSNNTSLDDLQEVADFIESNKEELRDLTGLMNEGGKLRLDSRLSQTDITSITYNVDGDLDTIIYNAINFYNPVDNTATKKLFEVEHEYNVDKLLTKVIYIINDAGTKTKYASNTFSYSNDNVTDVTWTLI